MYAVQKFLVTN